MIIETDFDMGQEIFYIIQDEDYKNFKCTFCGDDNKIVGKDKRIINCPVCSGTGEIERLVKEKWFVGTEDGSMEGSIQNIHIKNISISYSEGDESLDIKYGPLCPCCRYSVDDLFLTLKEAQAECERRNVNENE